VYTRDVDSVVHI